MRRLSTFIFAFVALVSLTVSASAQGRNCGPRDVVMDRLFEGYGETRQSFGMGANGAVIEVFANLSSGSWTMTLTQPSGITCLVASGQQFEVLAEALPSPGDDL